MKTVFTAFNGGLTVTEDEGKFFLNISEAASLGGGQAAGIVKVQGTASVEIDAETALKLGVQLVNSHLPPSVLPLAQVVEGVGFQALKALE